MTPVVTLCTLALVSTLEERARLAVAYAKARKLIEHERDIPRKAVELGGRMSPGYMGTLWVRLKKNPNGNQQRDKIALIAMICGVRRDWLLHDEGAMELTAEERATKSSVRGR